MVLTQSARRRFQTALSYVLLLSGAALIMIPLVWMVSTSLKEPSAVYTFPPKIVPDPVRWSNFPESLTIAPFGRFYVNTTIVTLANIVGHLLSCSLVAFAFARLRAPGKNLLFMLVLSTVMIPFYVRMIPLFILYRTFGWLDTLLPLIVPAFFAGNAFYIFLLRQFFLTINRELEDAARIDGCSTFGVYWRIILPLSQPALAMIAVFDFVFNWNDFLGPLIFLNSVRNRTVAVGLAYFQGSLETAPMMHLLMAAALISIIPVLVLFFFTQRYFIQGIVFTGMKG
ncbi:MAG: carbohydrate ABC transporter permease [Chloroflexota bacterium]|nr:carbohydrate ABC transporter permease [Chloroflexota bacterium]